MQKLYYLSRLAMKSKLDLLQKLSHGSVNNVKQKLRHISLVSALMRFLRSETLHIPLTPNYLNIPHFLFIIKQE